MAYVDLAFVLAGTRLPVDHGYALYSAVSRIVPGVHGARDVAIHPTRGRYGGDGMLSLTRASRLIVRVPDVEIHTYLPLTGNMLEVDDCSLRVGSPEVRTLRPAATLFARLVTIKGFMEPEPFSQAAWRQLERLGVTGDLHVGERRVFRVKDKQVVGFAVLVSGLDAEESIHLQESGIGGRRHMGCGVFVPFRQ